MATIPIDTDDLATITEWWETPEQARNAVVNQAFIGLVQAYKNWEAVHADDALVEAMAVAMWNSDGADDDWDEAGEHGRAQYLREARAALAVAKEALR